VLQLARVDAIAEGGDAGEEAPLVLDRLRERKPAPGKRMPAARFGEAAQQRGGACLEVEHAAVHAALLQGGDVLG